ncbi:hypothetical protein [Methylobacterium sp. D54C]
MATVAAGGVAVSARASPACVTIDTGLPLTCAWDAAQVENFQVFSSSGRKQIDNALIAELKKILKVFPINPGFKFINDTSPNAFASQASSVKDTAGTVFIGLNLINGEFNASDYGGVAVAGICAHECGHIYQFNTQWAARLSGPTAKRVELHADYLAGYYLGADASHAKDKAEAFAHSLFAKGDFNFNDRNHHGTPEQRVAAMRKGYEAGQAKVGIEAAAQSGANFVGGL